ncbi:MAG: thiamine pyrophosphate-dependent enzyme [Alphaproteobacteria bacterium]|nr:thiamine pyrophosphate-dependent enzyme [Alphaproteobacteria bacterium]
MELGLGIVWLVMNNNAFGTIAGLQKTHYGHTDGTTFPGSASNPASDPDYANIAASYRAQGIKVGSAEDLLPALEEAIPRANPPCLTSP